MWIGAVDLGIVLHRQDADGKISKRDSHPLFWLSLPDEAPTVFHVSREISK